MALAASNKRVFLPAPTLGINGRDSLFEMDQRYCLDQVNIYPNYDKSKLRSAFQELGSKSGIGIMRRLVSVTTAAGVTSFLLIRNSANIESITSAGVFTTIASILDTEINFANFRNIIFGAGGGSGPVDYNGTTLNSTAWSGSGLTITNLESPWVYRNRLYFLEATTSNLWYTENFDAITGTLLKLPLAANFKGGGYAFFGGSFSSNTGSAIDDYCVVVSNMGEILLFEGDDPKASNWRQIGRYFTAPPISRSGFFYYGKDLHILTTQGIIAMSDIVADNKEGSQYVSVSKQIDPLLTPYFATIQASPESYVNLAHCAISASENLLYLPIQRTENWGTPATQGFFVMNLATRAWGWYAMPSVSFLGERYLIGCCNDESKVYFVIGDTSTGRQALWKTGVATFMDNANEPMPWSIVHPFLGGRDGDNKKFNKVRPFLENGLGVTLGMFPDFTQTVATSGAISLSTTINKKYYDFNREAAFAALKISGTTSGATTASPTYYGSLMTYEPASNPP